MFPLILPVGEPITLRPGRSGGEVDRAAARASDGRAGVRFAATPEHRSMDMGFSMIRARIAEAGDDGDRRGASRRPVEIDARVRELGDNGTEARVLNISQTGFMARSEGRFEVGSRVWLILPGRERANAVVKWTAG
ncbi:MAG: PilZ domain-containing protein, partial [Pseudomonadota bacterium]|nr:PilZ domain-containing protein [Pseudomonadota bacterium]